MIVEIGTSDFRSHAFTNQKGLYVEPVKEYFDRLPQDCLKENVAVSNYDGEIDIYHIPSVVIEKRKLPDWLRGCNSVGAPHPTVMKMGLQQYCEISTVQVVRIKDLLHKHGIEGIDLLKIDTEGHDCVILQDFLDTCHQVPQIIQFENNVLSDPAEVARLKIRLQHLGYRCQQIKNDMVCRL